MIDNIIIEKSWFECEDFFEIRVTGENKYIKAQTEVYVSDAFIEELCAEIDLFITRMNEEFVWNSGVKGSEYVPCVEFVFKMKDRLGHVVVEVFMELNDNSDCKHNCCFAVDTELGLLERFGQRLRMICNSDLGTRYALNEER